MFIYVHGANSDQFSSWKALKCQFLGKSYSMLIGLIKEEKTSIIWYKFPLTQAVYYDPRLLDFHCVLKFAPKHKAVTLYAT